MIGDEREWIAVGIRVIAYTTVLRFVAKNFLSGGLALVIVSAAAHEQKLAVPTQDLLRAADHGPADKQTFNVLSYGAKGDGLQDEQLAIERTLKAAAAWTDSNPSRLASVIFPLGRYNLSHVRDLYAIQVRNMHDISIEGQSDPSDPWNRPQLIGAAASLSKDGLRPVFNTFFKVEDSARITIKNFIMDKAVPYFSQGLVTRVDVATSSVDILADDGYMLLDSPIAQRLENVVMFFPNSTAVTWDHSEASCVSPENTSKSNHGCYNWHVTAKRPLGGLAWRLVLDRPPLPKFDGDKFLIWKNLGWEYGVLINRSNNISVKNVFYTGGGGPAVNIQSSAGDNLIENAVVDVPPGSNRLFAATSGFNGGHNRGTITLRHVQVRRVDDDAFHFSAGPYFPGISQSIDGRSLRLGLCYDREIKAGDQLVAWNWATKTTMGSSKVVSVSELASSPQFPRQCEVTLEGSLPPLREMATFDQATFGRATDRNDRIADLTLKPILTVEDSYLSSMRAHCGIIQVPAVYRSNTCQNTPFGGLLIGPEYQWSEGYPVDNVNIEHSVFDNVGGTAIRIANVRDSMNSADRETLLAKQIETFNETTANRNISILANTFQKLGRFDRGFQGVSGVAISVEDAERVTILDNIFDRSADATIIVAPGSTRNVSKQ